MIAAAEAQQATWPDALGIDASGHVTLDRVDLDALARSHGTPLWVVSRSTVEGNYDALAASFRRRYPRCEVAYSIKAHNTLAIIDLVHRRGAPIDTSSEFEVQMALRAGVPAGDVIVNGNGKSAAALEQAARLGVRQVNVDSLDEARRLDRIAGELGVRVPCLVRIQLGYERLLREDPSFESTLRIGEGKFGSNVASGQAYETIEAVVSASNLDFLGLHHHVGFSGYMGDYTAEREVMHHRECTAEACAVANEARRRFGVAVRRLDLGGGFRGGQAVLLATPGAANDLSLHALPPIDDYAEAVFGTLERELDADEPPLVQFESGGYVIGNAVAMLATVSEIKDVAKHPPRRFVAVDCSMMMFVSRGMMRVAHPVLPAVDPLREPDDVAVELCGQTCVYDSIAEEIRLPALAAGDVVVLLNQGAYCETQSTQFGGYPRPEVVLVADGTATSIKRAETLDDVVQRDTFRP